MGIAEFIYTVLLKPPLFRKGANFILTSILPRTVKVRGATIHLNPADPVVSGALTLRSYENEEIDFFVKCFEPEMTLVDVGANVGLYTGLALHKPSKAKILCVEPDKSSFGYLKQTIQSNSTAAQQDNIAIHNLAASDSKGELTLYKNSENKGDNRIYADPLCNEHEKIASDTLDNLCEQAGLEHINYLKVDVQGAEFKVFSGARKILSQSPNCIVMTEFWPYGLRQCGSTPQQYLHLLRDLGFTLYELSGKTLEEIKDFDDIIARSPGRVYKNLVALKGKYSLKAASL
ncbi:MAG: FkbM family methyltransferase [Chthoniobacterales bacterium]